ncbi:unnamed protein product [Candidula unifasciata]|uniref:Poly(A)-specific ribonuclease PARN n=1 Tax=Candidula unifasciata TaxID=100452 RepID=A0A8S3ZPM1_9EUPU|nr:unnamed protein product [Candidula unifasciata]
MEITRHTFSEQLETVIKDINESAFIAIDGEFTGLDATASGHASHFDTPEERYNKIRQECSDFLLIQFGLCAFKADEEKRRYEAKPYNFYIFPTPLTRHAPDRRFLCQSSSIDFLCSQGFDFNKLFKEGIPFLIPDEENKLKAELERKHEEARKSGSGLLTSPYQGSAKKNYASIPEEQKPFLDNICEQIAEYLKGQDKEPLVIPPCNAFQRKLIYQTVEERFPDAHIETKTGEKKIRYMEVTRAKSPEEQQKLLKEKQNLEKMELDIQVGFTKVIRAITSSGKLVVGHNMFLDVFHILNNFHGTLPADLEEFKAVTKSVFPRLLDTKLMASTRPLQELISFSGLSDVLQTLQSPPFLPVQVDVAEGFERYHNGAGALHEAGYDALITGRCFATMVNYLGTLQNPPKEFTLPSSHIVEPFVNKLFLMRINDIPYLNLDGPDLRVNREHVFHVTFPKEWKPSDLHALFQPYGAVQISWLTETTAYVALHKKENASMALKALSQHVGSFHVISYAAHHLSKSTRFLSASSPAPLSSPSIPAKRKLKVNEADTVPRKAKRHSLTDEVSPYPVIPEEDESLNDSTTETVQHESCNSDLGQKMEDGETEKTKEKLFDESGTW